jgi:hypothetical protein
MALAFLAVSEQIQGVLESLIGSVINIEKGPNQLSTGHQNRSFSEGAVGLLIW